MGMSRRGFLGGAAGWALAARAARAQPVRTGVVRLVLGFAPGGAADRVARVLAPELARLNGRGAIVENVPGANGARAIQRVAASDPDGDTLLMATSAVAHPDNAAAMEALRPVILTSTTPMVLVVRASLPLRDTREFGRWLAAHPAATYGSAGLGNATHLGAAELVGRLGATATHVPYSGATPAFGDLIGGHIDFIVMVAQIPLAVVELRDGGRCTAAELVAYARDLLGVRAPRRVEVLDALPRNPQGKVMKRALAERFARPGS